MTLGRRNMIWLVITVAKGYNGMGCNLILWNIRSSICDMKNESKSLQRLIGKCVSILQPSFGSFSWTFRHHNAPIHTAKLVKSCIQQQNVDIMAWPPYFPDLNIIDNVWGWLTRRVYVSGDNFHIHNQEWILLKAPGTK